MNSRTTFLSFALTACSLIAGPIWGDTQSDDAISPDLGALERDIAQLEVRFDKTLPHTLPIGTVMGWAGSVNELPEGWALCNGRNGTPDLRERFILGAASDGEMGKTGGSRRHRHGGAEHDHLVTGRNHRHSIPPWQGTTAAAGEHSHHLGQATGNAVGVDEGADGGGLGGYWSKNLPTPDHTHETTTASSHSHSLSILRRSTGFAKGFGYSPTSIAEPATRWAENMPPYYRLAYIVKLGHEEDPPDLGAALGKQLLSLSSLETEIMALRTALDALASYRAPLDLIVAWTGSLADLPAGWVLCDGTNGTPDLRGKFILGAGLDDEIGKTGDDATHGHGLEAHRHRATGPAHTHVVPRSSGSTDYDADHTHEVGPAATGRADGEENNPDAYTADPDHLHPTSESGRHAHDVVLPEQPTSPARSEAKTRMNSHDIAERSHLPPYYKLAYIQKIPYADLGGAVPSPKEVAEPGTRIAGLLETVAYLRDELGTTLTFLVPPKTIGIWSGPLDDVPTGWALCDGQQGTPDLRRRFVLGAARRTGETGGEPNHSHALRSHAHRVDLTHGHAQRESNLETATRDSRGHFHRTGGASDTFEGDPQFFDSVAANNALFGHEHMQGTIRGYNIHEHTLTLYDNAIALAPSLSAMSDRVTGSTRKSNNRPPFYQLAFVMKLVEEKH